MNLFRYLEMKLTAEVGDVWRVERRGQSLPTMHRRSESVGDMIIDIYRDRVWTGEGVIRDGRIVNCTSVQLGGCGKETEEIYCAIEAAMAQGKNAILWSQNRPTHFAWHIR